MIFLSYCWKNKEIAELIDSYFDENDIKIIRDIRDLAFKQSIKEFMEIVRDADYVIMIISKEYLESKNCMYEVTEFVKDRNFKDRIIPIITEESGIFDVNKQIKYLNYWGNKKKKLTKTVESLPRENSIPISQELKEYVNIEALILDFIDIIIDMKNIVISEANFNLEHFDKIRNYINRFLYDLNTDNEIKRSLGSFTPDGVLEKLELLLSQGKIFWGRFCSTGMFDNLELLTINGKPVWQISAIEKEDVGINLYNLPSNGKITFEYFIGNMNILNPNISFYMISVQKGEKLLEVGSDTYDEKNAPFSLNRKRETPKKILNKWIKKTIEYEFDDSEVRYVIFAPRINEGCIDLHKDNGQIKIRNVVVRIK